MPFTTKELTPELWPHLKQLFGSDGACGGCWCQAWRIEKGEHWSEVKGAKARTRMRNGVQNGTVHGFLAFDKKTPIGWCTFGPRDSFPRLNRAPTLRCSDSSRVWSLPCFFVPRAYRGQGVASALLSQALRAMEKRGVEIAEAYPTKPDKNGLYIAAFSWTGTRPMFKNAGFTVVGNPDGSKQRVRKILGKKNGGHSSEIKGR
jgi:GNAT superfamily N-acetyltransferase